MNRELKTVDPAPAERWTIADLEVMADRVAKSRLFGLDASQAFTLMLMAHAEGIHPAKAVQRYHVIQGRPAMRADAMLADFLRIGGSVKWLTESDDREKCEAVFSHARTAPEGKTIRFTIEDARIAGLLGNPTWQKYAPSMMRARVTSIAVRMLAPGIVAGLYTPEEVSDMAIEATATVMPVTPVAPEHHAVNHDNQTGHGSGAYAPPDQVQAYSHWIATTCEDINIKWLENVVDKHTGEIIGKAPAELVSTWQLSGHLLKFAKGKGWVDAPEDVRAGQRDKLAAIAYERHREEIEEEAFTYCRSLWKRAQKAHKRSLSNPEPDGSQEPTEEEEIIQ